MAETVLNQQEPKLDPSVDTQRQNLFLKKIVGIILSIVMVVMTVYVLNLLNHNYNTLSKSMDVALSASDHATSNYRTYMGKFRETRVELDETTHKLVIVNGQLTQVSSELSTAKGALAQTQGMLTEAQDENTNLKQELQGLDDLQNSENVKSIGELGAKIKSLKNRDVQISHQLVYLTNQLRVYSTEFSNTDAGKSLIALFQKKIRLVKTRMSRIKQEAFLARVEAQKQKDRLAALNGNSGFVVRNGQVQNPTGAKKSFAIDVKIVQ